MERFYLEEAALIVGRRPIRSTSSFLVSKYFGNPNPYYPGEINFVNQAPAKDEFGNYIGWRPERIKCEEGYRPAESPAALLNESIRHRAPKPNYDKIDISVPDRWRYGLALERQNPHTPSAEENYVDELCYGFSKPQKPDPAIKGKAPSSNYIRKKLEEDVQRRALYASHRRTANVDRISRNATKGTDWIPRWKQNEKRKSPEPVGEARFVKAYDIVRDKKPPVHEPYRTDWSEDEWQNCSKNLRR